MGRRYSDKIHEMSPGCSVEQQVTPLQFRNNVSEAADLNAFRSHQLDLALMLHNVHYEFARPRAGSHFLTEPLFFRMVILLRDPLPDTLSEFAVSPNLRAVCPTTSFLPIRFRDARDIADGANRSLNLDLTTLHPRGLGRMASRSIS